MNAPTSPETTNDLERWREDGERCGWQLPLPAPRLLRMPVIRHARAALLTWKVERHYAYFGGALGLMRTGYDEWVIYAIARGMC